MAKFFTKKVCLIILAVVVAAGGIVWAVVANITPQFNSGITDIPPARYVSGNGTASVMVDNYLYFVGDSIETAKIAYHGNDYYRNGTMPDTGIFRVKIGTDGQPILNYKYDNTYVDEETGKKSEWKPGDAKYNTVATKINDWNHLFEAHNGIEAVVPKIAGHDKTAMWVFGKYLLYVTPHDLMNDRGELMSNYLDFFRVNLDGTDHTLIYTTESTNLTTKDFTVWADSKNNINLLVSESDNESEKPETKIKKINVKTKEVTVLARKVSNVVLPTATQYGKQNESLADVYGGVMSYVYYTKDAAALGENSTLKGNLLYRCAIDHGKPEVIIERGNTNDEINFTPIAVTPVNVGGAVANAQLVFSIDKTPATGKYLCVMTNQNMNDKINLEGFNYAAHDIGLTASNTIAIYANGFCQIDKNIRHYTIENSQIELDATVLLTNVDAVLAVVGNTIYAQSGNTIYAVNQNGTKKTISTTVSTSNSETENSEESTEASEDNGATNILPIAVLYQPAESTGAPVIFFHTEQDIRLIYSDQTYKYLRFKEE